MALILSIEFTELECKVALADQGKGSRFAVKSLSSFELPRPDDLALRVPERAAALRDHLKAQKISAKNAVIVIPKSFVMARTVSLPSTVDSEIAGMAKFEAERHIPFNADRHIVSYHVLAKQGMQGSDVLLAAVDLPIAQEYLDICVKAGLSVTGITVSSISMFNAFALVEKTALADRTIMLLNVGRTATDLIIANNGNITFTRGSNIGVSRLLSDLTVAADRSYEQSDLPSLDALEPQLSFAPARPAAPAPQVGAYDNLDGTAPEGGIQVLGGERESFDTPPPSAAASNPAVSVFSDWLTKLLQEATRTYEFANREFNCPMVNHVYITGEGALIKRISQYFQANFNIDAGVFDPLHGADVSATVKKANQPAQPYAIALGGTIARQPGAVQINLLPGSYTEARSAKRQQRSYFVTGFLVLLALGAGYFYISEAFNRKQVLLEEVLEQNTKDKSRVTDLNTKKTRLRIISENVQNSKGSALQLFELLSSKEYFPDTVALYEFDYKRGDYLKLRGDAKDLPSANQLLTDLRNTGYFEEAKMDNTETNKILRGRPPVPVLGWSATFSFPKPVKAKPKSTAKASEDENDGNK